MALAVVSAAQDEASDVVPGTLAFLDGVPSFTANAQLRRSLLATPGVVEINTIMVFPEGTDAAKIDQAVAGARQAITDLANDPAFREAFGVTGVKTASSDVDDGGDDDKKKIAIGVGVGVGVGVPLLIAIIVFLVLRRKQQVVQPGSSA
mmetsp:Transcript_1131/g.3180  ORF Transcript_1131/g.3180 Transcript_1131/m.3180 type:complete len:149 (+) Transcript_1131:3341-3787(+)